MKLYLLNWISGILGFWIILLAFLGFSSTLTKFFLIVSGAAIVFSSFKMASFLKPPEKMRDSEIFPEKEAGRAEDNTQNNK